MFKDQYGDDADEEYQPDVPEEEEEDEKEPE